MTDTGSINLTPEQRKWLNAHVASGEYSSIDDAVRQIINERIAEENDDLAWAKPYIDEARAAVARGDVITLQEHKSRNASRLDSIKN